MNRFMTVCLLLLFINLTTTKFCASATFVDDSIDIVTSIPDPMNNATFPTTTPSVSPTTTSPTTDEPTTEEPTTTPTNAPTTSPPTTAPPTTPPPTTASPTVAPTAEPTTTSAPTTTAPSSPTPKHEHHSVKKFFITFLIFVTVLFSIAGIVYYHAIIFNTLFYNSYAQKCAAFFITKYQSLRGNTDTATTTTTTSDAAPLTESLL